MCGVSEGGTLGEVWLFTGTAEIVNNRKIPYKVVLKIQKKWERPGDPNSWRREYDLYVSDFDTIFQDSFRWPVCYHAEIIGDQIQLWMEYIDGISGDSLTIEMLEHIAEELGRFPGRSHKQPEILLNLSCLGDSGFLKREYEQWTLPEHMRRMLSDTQQRSETIFADMKCLSVVLCHRDFWIENIFLSDDKIRLIDWDCTGWGYIGEDIVSLITDDTDVEYLNEYYHRLIAAYYKGLSEYLDISNIEYFYIQEMMIIKFDYRILQKYMFSESYSMKNQQIEMLQKIYELRDDS